MAKKAAASNVAKKAPASKPLAKAKEVPSRKAAVKKAPASKRVKGKALPHNMTANEPMVGKRHPDEAVPAIEKNVKTKPVAAGKAKIVTVPVRTGTAGGRPGGGSTGELSPAKDTAAGRGHGQRRTKR